jgi:Na+/proline symporter
MIILLGVAVYIVIMLAIGIYSSGKTHSVAEFAVAGRSMSMWLCTATIVATWFGGGVMIGVAGAAYDHGMLGVIADPFGAGVALVLIGLFFVRLVRRLRLFSFIEILEQRFGLSAGIISSFASMVSSLGWVAGMLIAFGVIFEVVVLVDTGGWAPIAAQLPEGTFRMIPHEHSLDSWLFYLRAWLIFGFADIASQSLLQRAMSAKSEQVAQNSFYAAAISYVGFAMIPVMLGIIASVTMPGLANSESVVPALALEHLHPLPLIKRNPSERTQLMVIRLAIPVGGFLAVSFALNAGSVFDTVLDANVLMLAAVIAPFILGMWWKKANRAGALSGMSAGIATWLAVSTFAAGLPADLLGFVSCVVVMLVVTPLTQEIDPPRGLVWG